MTNANYGTWPDGGDGDTAQRSTHAATEGRADLLEDSILRRVDMERQLERVVTAHHAGMKGIYLRVPCYPAMRKQLGAFIDRLVTIMTFAPEDGGGSATRAYTVCRRAQLGFNRGEAFEAYLSPNAARALRSELRVYLPAGDHILRELMECLLAAKPTRAKARSGGRR